MLSNAIPVTADVVGLYTSIPQEANLKVLYKKQGDITLNLHDEKLGERVGKRIALTDSLNMAEVILTK